MIRVVYNRKTRRVTVKGHAGAAPKGNDIVCAAVSALTYTLAANALDLKDCGFTRRVMTRLDHGDSEIHVTPKRPWRGTTDLVFSSVCVGFRLLAENYPKYIEYQEVR